MDTEKLDTMIQLKREIRQGLTKARVAIFPDPDLVGSYCILRGEQGRFTIPTWRVALACPAGVTTVLPLNIPPGWVAYRRKPIEVSSDFYDPLLGLNIYSDDILINLAPMALTGDFVVDLGEYLAQWVQLNLEVINATAFAAVVSFQVCTHLIEVSLWEEEIVPLIKGGKEKFKEIIEWRNGSVLPTV